MIKKEAGILRIGTSGIVVPVSKQSFPPEFQNKSRLSYYSSLFNTLEVNSSFKKVPLPSTFKRWSEEVSKDFQFTVKLWKEITHIKKLDIDLHNIDTFLSATNFVENKKGCLLIQLPASITSEYFSKVAAILQRINQLDHENNWRKAIEFRSVTWYSNETYQLLYEHKVSAVLQDMPDSKNLIPNENEPFFYFRFHGPKGDYKGSYTEEFLKEQAEKIRRCLDEGKDVYAYFNNTMGSALENAVGLKNLVENQA